MADKKPSIDEIQLLYDKLDQRVNEGLLSVKTQPPLQRQDIAVLSDIKFALTHSEDRVTARKFIMAVAASLVTPHTKNGD